MLKSIFMESSEKYGLLYNRYHNIPDRIDNFLDVINKAVIHANRKGISEEYNVDLPEELNKFRKEVEIDVKVPDAVHTDEIRKQRTKVKSVKQRTLKLLDKLGKIKKNAGFGKNFINGILIKPKVYQNDIDEDSETEVNNLVRNINRCMDWAERTIIDTMNLADQDMNILSLVEKVYWKKIYEGVEESTHIYRNLLECPLDDDDYFEEAYLSYDSDADETDSITDQPVDNNEEFFPVFSIVVSYDFDTTGDLNKDQQGMIQMGSIISAVTRGDQYTHTFLSLDTSFENLYHFVAKGIVRENILDSPIFDITKSIYVNVTFVTKEEKEIILDELNRILMDRDDAKYDTIQVINQMFGKSKHVDKRMICSTFVGYILACGNLKNLHRDYSMIRPEDITLLPRAFYVINFENKQDFINRRSEFEQRLRRIYDDNIDEIREYNNILPKVIIKSKFKEKGGLDGFFDWITKKYSQ